MPFGGLLTVGLIGAGASIYGAHKQGKQADKAAKNQADLNNLQLQAQKEAQAKILAGLEGSGINPFGINTLHGGDTRDTVSNRSYYDKSNPFVTADYAKQDALVRGILENRLTRGSSLPPGYEAGGIRKINEANAGARLAAQNAAASKGLSGAAVFGLNAPIETSRANQIADFRTQLPLLERQLMNEDIATSGNRQAQFGTGQERQGTSKERSHSEGSLWNEHGPDIGGLASLLMPPGAQQSTISPNSASGNAFSALGSSALGFAGALGQQRANQAPSGTQPGQGSTPAGQCPPGSAGTYPFCY